MKMRYHEKGWFMKDNKEIEPLPLPYSRLLFPGRIYYLNYFSYGKDKEEIDKEDDDGGLRYL